MRLTGIRRHKLLLECARVNRKRKAMHRNPDSIRYRAWLRDARRKWL